MKLTKIMVAALFASALMASPTFAADTKGCCEKAKATGKVYTHLCCVTVEEDQKSCEKYNPKQAEKSAEEK